MSTVEGVFTATWPSVLALAEIADNASFEAQVPIARWRGFGGPTNFNGQSYETFTWSAGVGAATRNSAVFCTSHVPTIHPIVAAKQATTVDHITGGRFALNIVCGWYEDEFRMFGKSVAEHDSRYDYAEEWLEIVRRLWTSDEEFDFEGKYFKIERGFHQPKPIQAPFPALMNAGVSDRGKHFSCKNCDMIFTAFPSASPDDIRARVDQLRAFARLEYGREIQIWGNVTVVQGDTEQDARQLYNHCIMDRGDWEAAGNMVRMLGMEGKGERAQRMKERFVAGWGGIPLVGTAEQITSWLEDISSAGVDGCLVTCPRYEEGLRRFSAEVIPHMEEAGLRQALHKQQLGG